MSTTNTTTTPCGICLGAGWYLLAVPEDDPRYNRPQRCECQREGDAAKKRARLAAASSWYPEMAALTFKTWDRSRFRRACLSAEAFCGLPDMWLAIYGPPGMGKTHLLAAITNEVTARGRAPLYALTSALLDYLRAGFEQHDSASRQRLLREADVLLLDDLMAEDSTEWAHAILQDALEYRYERHLPTVLASNVPIEAWPFRLASRAQDTSRSRVLDLDDDAIPDYRTIAGKGARHE